MSPVEIAILLVWSFSVSLAGGMVGLVLGNLRLPVVVWLGSSAATAAGANVAISGLAALRLGDRFFEGASWPWRK